MWTLFLTFLIACGQQPPVTPAASEPAPAAQPANAEPADEPAAPPVEEPAEEPSEEPAEEPSEEANDKPAEDPSTDKPDAAEPTLLAAGEACFSGDQCASGLCEGEGCGDANPGQCAPETRPCTRDLRPYCGCDGQTFRAGGNCPRQRYAHKGECE